MIYEAYINQPPAWLIFLFMVVVIWEIIWKGVGLWYAGKQKQKGWFVAILLLNTLGLLPIVYLAFFRKKEEEKDLAHFARAHEEHLKAQLLKPSKPKRSSKRK